MLFHYTFFISKILSTEFIRVSIKPDQIIGKRNAHRIEEKEFTDQNRQLERSGENSV